jgi:hypothetical protein
MSSELGRQGAIKIPIVLDERHSSCLHYDTMRVLTKTMSLIGQEGGTLVWEVCI